MQAIKSVTFIISALLLAPTTWAQQSPRLGLWEQWTTPKLNTKEPASDVVRMMEESKRQTKAKLAALPPEKREALNKEMAEAGVDLHLDKPDGTMSVQFCIDEKEAARLAAIREQDKNTCKTKVTTQPGDITVVEMACQDKATQRISQSTATYYGNKAYTLDFPMAVANARWLRDDCPQR